MTARGEYHRLGAGLDRAAHPGAPSERDHRHAQAPAQSQRTSHVVARRGVHDRGWLRRASALQVQQLREHPGVVAVRGQRLGARVDALAQLLAQLVDERAQRQVSRKARSVSRYNR